MSPETDRYEVTDDLSDGGEALVIASATPEEMADSIFRHLDEIDRARFVARFAQNMRMAAHPNGSRGYWG